MGWQAFIASLVSSLAWPAVVGTLVIVLKQPISRLLTSRPMKRLKAGPSGVEIEYFDEVIADARQELAAASEQGLALAASAERAESEAAAGVDDFMEEMSRLADVAPSAAVLESYARLERVLRQAADDVLPVEGRPRVTSMRALGRAAAQKGLIADSELSALDDVAVVRNLIAHGAPAELDKERALQYVSIIRQLIVSISLAQGRTVSDGWPARPPHTSSP